MKIFFRPKVYMLKNVILTVLQKYQQFKILNFHFMKDILLQKDTICVLRQ